MKIAIVGSFPFHFECVGFIIQSLPFAAQCTVYTSHPNTDSLGYVEYFQSLRSDVTVTAAYQHQHQARPRQRAAPFSHSFKELICSSNDVAIKLTSHDPCMDSSNMVSILHLNRPPQRACQSSLLVSLTPYITGSNIHFCLPIFDPYRDSSPFKMTRIEKAFAQKQVIMVGYYGKNNFDDDLLCFITQNPDYHFHFVMRQKVQLSKVCKNMTLHSCMPTSQLMQMLGSQCTFVLSKKSILRDRLSGQLALAVSFELPLIIDTATHVAYRFPSGLEFTSKYTEIGTLSSRVPSIVEYRKLVLLLRQYKAEVLRTNRETMTQICFKK